MGRKPGRASTRAAGDKRAGGQAQAGGSIGRVRETDTVGRSHLDKKMSEPPLDPTQGGGKKAKYQEDMGKKEE